MTLKMSFQVIANPLKFDVRFSVLRFLTLASSRISMLASTERLAARIYVHYPEAYLLLCLSTKEKCASQLNLDIKDVLIDCRTKSRSRAILRNVGVRIQITADTGSR